MILGVVSDTHNRLSNIAKIIDIFNSNKVDLVIHTGDITKAETLRKFSDLNCSLMGVYGNNDLLELDLKKTSEEFGFDFREPPFITTIGNKKIAIFHEPETINETIENDDMFRSQADYFIKEFNRKDKEYCESLIRNAKIVEDILDQISK